MRERGGMRAAIFALAMLYLPIQRVPRTHAPLTRAQVLARLDSAGAKPAVLAGLTTPSYRDVIQTAAIAASAQVADSAIVDGLEKVLGQQELAAITLATRARDGDSQALSILVRHRDDKRAWVRRWVLDAIDQELGKAAAE